MARMGVGMLAVLAPLQLVIGDFHGLNTARHQPAKLAAIEAHWHGNKPAGLGAVRVARREGRAQPLRGCHSEGREPDHHT